MRSVVLSNGLSLPALGLGTWQVTDREQMRGLVKAAYDAGYRLFDTAAAYGNEIALGRAIALSGIPREDICLSDKVWNTNRGFDAVQSACRRSLKKLKTDYLDVYLIHWPASPKLHADWEDLNAQTWRGMEALYREGLVRAIGVCNFTPRHLQALRRTAQILPMIDQIEFHPGMPQAQTAAYCAQNGIALEASSPLGNGQILQNETLLSLAAQTGRTPAQVALRWALQKNAVVLPKTTNPARLKENMDLFDFTLSDAQMRLLDELPFCGGLAIDPDEVTEFG